MSISAVLLAGGESRRMGQDKATLLFRGRPLWQNQLDVLRKLKSAELLISARSDPDWRPADATFVADVSPSRGPLSGLSAALAQMKSTHLLALAIDMPFMHEAYLKSLCNQIEPGRGLLPMIGGRAEPLAAIFPAEAQPQFEAALRGVEFSLQALTAELVESEILAVLSVARADENLFRNMNKPIDLVS